LNAGAARFGAPLAVSLALHAVVLGAMAGGSFTTSGARADLVVYLAFSPETAPAAQPPSAPAARSALPKRYLASSEVDQRATPVDMAALVYPETPYRNRIAGKVRVRIYISEQGRVDKAEIVEATPKGHFEEAAIDVVQRTRFDPARKQGRAVPSQKLIEVEFDPYGPTPEERL
jgi:TonB family protein